MGGLTVAQWTKIRRKIQIVFQDAYASLNRYMTVEKIIQEPLKIHGLQGNIDELLVMVGLSSSLKKRYPQELSGGQCRRVCLARALSLQPIFLLADELTSGLDIDVQIGLLDLLLNLNKQLNLTCLFITHDLDVAEYLAHRVGIIKRGKMIEVDLKRDLLLFNWK